MKTKKTKPGPEETAELFETLKMGFIPDKFCSSFSLAPGDKDQLSGPSSWRKQLSQYVVRRKKRTPPSRIEP